MENNEPLIQLPISDYDKLIQKANKISDYDKLIQKANKYSIIVESILDKHNVKLRWDKNELVLKCLTEEIFMKILKTFEPRRYNHVFEELIKEDKKEK